MTQNDGVVIVGGGIVGIATAYFLGKRGVRSTIIERDSVGSHASGFAYGGLSPTGETGASGQLTPGAQLTNEGMRIHRDLSKSLPEESGINTEYRERPSVALTFTDEEVRAAKERLATFQAPEGCQVEWLDAAAARSIEPRISEEIQGAVHTIGQADVEPYRLVLALAQVVENQGSLIRHGEVTGLRRESGRVTGVVLSDEVVDCETVVLAAGPWSDAVSDWIDTPIEISPLKGQILRLRAPGRPFECSLGWEGHYATTKPDGLLWTGTTEEHAGYDENTTTEARDAIMGTLLKMAPSLTEAQLVQQTACLRPVASDGELIMGQAPGVRGAYLATGTGRKGILLGPAVGRITADLITTGDPGLDIEAFSPARFAR